MSKIYEKLKEAEAARQRVMAERQRPESETDAARLTVQGRAAAEAKADRLSGDRTKRDTPRAPIGAWLAVAIVALAGGITIGMLVPRKGTPPLEPRSMEGALPLKLDRDFEAFASRIKEPR